MFYFSKEIKLEKPVRIFLINAFLLQKLKNKMFFHAFPIETIPPVFHEVKLPLYGNQNAQLYYFRISEHIMCKVMEPKCESGFKIWFSVFFSYKYRNYFKF